MTVYSLDSLASELGTLEPSPSAVTAEPGVIVPVDDRRKQEIYEALCSKAPESILDWWNDYKDRSVSAWNIAHWALVTGIIKTQSEIVALWTMGPATGSWFHEKPSRALHSAAKIFQMAPKGLLQDAPKGLLEYLQMSEDGVPLPILDNAQRLLQEAEWQLDFNEAQGNIRVTKAPIPIGRADEAFPKYLENVDVLNITAHLQKTYKSHFSKQTVCDALEIVAKSRRFDPFKEYLLALPAWDGTERGQTTCMACLGIEDTRMNREKLRKFGISIVARTMEPGCKADCMPVFIGKQGVGKSSYWMLLVGDDQYGDDLPSIQDQKVVGEYIQGLVIAEVADMAGFGRAELSRIKSFITTRKDRYRAPFAILSESRKRRCLFIGTSNHYDLFLDETDNRRFWVLECAVNPSLPLPEIRETVLANRDQIFAEWLFYYSRGDTNYFEKPEEAEAIEKENRNHLELDPWYENMIANPVFMAKRQITTLEVLNLVGLEIGKQTKMDLIRAGRNLVKLGFERKRVEKGWIYVYKGEV